MLTIIKSVILCKKILFKELYCNVFDQTAIKYVKNNKFNTYSIYFYFNVIQMLWFFYMNS